MVSGRAPIQASICPSKNTAAGRHVEHRLLLPGEGVGSAQVGLDTATPLPDGTGGRGSAVEGADTPFLEHALHAEDPVLLVGPGALRGGF